MTSVQPLPKSLDRPIRIGALISGGGTTVKNFVRRIADGRLQAEVALVIASRSKCGGVALAKDAGIPTVVVSRRDFADVESFSTAVFDQLRAANVDLVTLAGFLSLLKIPD